MRSVRHAGAGRRTRAPSRLRTAVIMAVAPENATTLTTTSAISPTALAKPRMWMSI
jgi:hypothetical protein